MQFNRCFGCMKEIKGYPCPHCGFDPRAQQDNYVLPCGTVLGGHYVVGKVLGQGGFGITYIGFDLSLQRRVAIKEFYPKGQAMRMAAMGSSLHWASDGVSQTVHTTGMDSFLREAQKMAKVEDIPEVVGVRECFRENDTAYIIMNYIEGRTLLSVLKEKGPMPWEQARDIFLPAISAMEKVHQAGLVHRDLSPDNLMLTDKGVRILDLGAAKDLSSGSGASSAQVAKGGFSPFEQYTQRGGSGPWSDVYAMAATIYYTLTGVLPPNATERVEKDSLNWKLLSQRGVPANVISALQKAMTVTVKGRTQSMAELLSGLQNNRTLRKITIPRVNAEKINIQKKYCSEVWRKYKRAIMSVTIFALIPLVIYLCFFVNAQRKSAASEVHVMAKTENLSELDDEKRKNQPFWGQSRYKRSDVKTVTFRDSLTGVPDNAWDVSEAGDRSILAWMDDGNLLVAANGKIAPNPNASWMFAHFVNVTAIDFGDCFDTSGVSNMWVMFSDCTDLTELDVSGFDTSNVTDMRGMFYKCSNLSQMDVSGFDTSNVTDMRGMFGECSSLTDLDVSGFDTANVTNMLGMFSDCSALTDLDLSGFDTANVTDMAGMFQYCSLLTKLDLSCFDTANVTDMRCMFYGCTSLTILNVSGFDTAKVTDMHAMFYNCTNLKSLNLSTWDANRVTEIYAMFKGCRKLNDFKCTDTRIQSVYRQR